MPLLGTCMYPEIGLAGSGTGTGVFRKEFMKERRRASQGAPKKGHKRTESCDVGVRPLERLEGVLAEGLPSPQSLSSRCDSGWTARDSCSSVSDSPWGSEVQGERRRRFTVNSSSTTSVEELPSACARTAARGKGRFLIADGVPLTGPVDKRLGSLVSRGRISGPNRKFAVHSPSVPRTFVAAEASALPTDSASASASALPPWSRSASAGDVSRMRWRGASPMEGAHPPASLPEEGVWHEGLSRESSMARLLAEAEGGTALLEAMALPRDAPGAPPAPQPLHMLAGLLEAQCGSTGQEAAGRRRQAGRRGREAPWERGGLGAGWPGVGVPWEEVPSLAARCPCGHPPRRVFARVLGAALCAREERPRAVAQTRRRPPPCPPPLPTALCPPQARPAADRARRAQAPQRKAPRAAQGEAARRSAGERRAPARGGHGSRARREQGQGQGAPSAVNRRRQGGSELVPKVFFTYS